MPVTPERMGKMLDDLRKKSGAATAMCYVSAGSKVATVIAVDTAGKTAIQVSGDSFKRAIAEAHMAIGADPPEDNVMPSATATHALLDAIFRGVNDLLNMTPAELRGEGIFAEKAQLVLSAAQTLTRIALAPTAEKNKHIEHLENALQKVNDARAALTDMPGVGVANLRQERIQEALDFLDGAKDIINKLTANGDTNGEERSSS